MLGPKKGAILVAFAQNAAAPVRQVEVFEAEGRKLAGPTARIEQQCENGFVASGVGRTGCGLEKRHDLFRGEWCLVLFSDLWLGNAGKRRFFHNLVRP